MLLERVRAGSEKAAELCPFPRSPGEGEARRSPRPPAEAAAAALGPAALPLCPGGTVGAAVGAG